MEDILREYLALVVRFLHKRATWGELRIATEVISQTMDDTTREGIMDRTEQINWLENLADDLTSNNWVGTAAEIVWYWIERMIHDGEALPEWFSQHDRCVLVRFVEARQNN